MQLHVHALVLHGKLTEIRHVNIRSYLLKGLKEYFFPLARGIVSVHPLFSFVRGTKNERLFPRQNGTQDWSRRTRTRNGGGGGCVHSLTNCTIFSFIHTVKGRLPPLFLSLFSFFSLSFSSSSFVVLRIRSSLTKLPSAVLCQKSYHI